MVLYKNITHPSRDIPITVSVQQAENELTDTLSLEGWTYGDIPASASAGFRFGTPRFLYSDRADGTYTDTVPASAGTWYVKAVADGTENYKGEESEPVSFVIAPRDTTTDSQITDYDVTKSIDGRKVTVAITFKGDYTGTVTKTYTMEDKMPADSTNTDNKNTGGKKAVQTGDADSAGLWLLLLSFSAGAAVFLKRKKHEEAEE